MANVTASIIVPTRNRLAQLRYTLESLRFQDAPAAAYEAVVVDDASQDPTPAWLATYRPPYGLTVVRAERPLGRSAVRNRGLAAASGDVAIFLDGDKLCPPTFVSAHLRLHAEGAADAAPTCVSGYPWCWRTIVTVSFDPPEPRPLLDPRLLSRWEEIERWAGGPLGEAGAPVAVALPEQAPFVWFVASACSLRRSVAREFGGFDERFQGYGLEDWEFGYRLQAAGTRFLAHPAASAFHQAHPPADRGAGDERRNLALFLHIHPDFEVALMCWHRPGTDGRYEHLYGANQRLRRVAPTLAAALREVAVDNARARLGRQPPSPRGWAFWAGRWGPERAARVLWDHLAAVRDGRARQVVPFFQDLAGIAPGGGHRGFGR